MTEVNSVLPVEVYERCIDLLRDDRQTLISCALTCRRWLPRSRHHLFNSISLRAVRQLTSLSNSLSSSPTSVSLIKELVIYDSKEKHRPNVFSLFSMMLAGRLTNVTHLKIERDFAAGPRPTPLRENFFISLSSFSSVTKLSLCMLQFSTFADFRRLICALPNISDLSCLHLSWLSMGPPPPTRPSRRLKLTALYLDLREAMAPVADWLLATAMLGDLHTLFLRFVDAINFGRMEQLFFVAGSSLVHLSIDLRSDNGMVAYLDRRMIAQQCLWSNVKLESFRIRFLQGIPDPRIWLEAFIAGIKSESIRRITFGLSAWRQLIILSQFEGIGKMLSEPKFSQLEELAFEWTGFTQEPNSWRSKLLGMLGMNDKLLLSHGNWKHSMEVTVRHIPWS